MIHTAREILEEVFDATRSPFKITKDELQLEITLNPSLDLIEKAINQGRVEAIKECAKAAHVKEPEKRTRQMAINNVSRRDYIHFDVDTDSILKLLDQIK